MQQYKKWKIENFPPALRGELEQYTRWLKTQSERYSSHGQDQELFDYGQNANRDYFENGKTIHPFAPFRTALSAYQTITRPQGTVLATLCIAVLASFIFFGIGALMIACSFLIVLYAFQLGVTCFAFLPSRQQEAGMISNEIINALDDADWPTYTILCPLYKEGKIAAQCVRALTQLDYPKDKLQVLFLLEQDDGETRAALSLLSLPPFCKVLVVPFGSPRTKPRACNYGLLHVRSQYCVIYDAEDIPHPKQLKKAVLTFAQHGPEVACVQASLNFYNTKQSLLTRFFTIEYSVWFDMVLPALQRLGIALPLGGTSNHFQATYLRALGGWDAYNVTEDCDLGMRLAQYGLTTKIMKSTTYEESTATFKNWIGQRTRWIKGYLQTYLVHMRQIRSSYKKPARFKTFLSLQWMIGIGTGLFFINPVMWFAFFLYLFFHEQVAGLYHLLFPTPILYLGTCCLIFGNLFFFYLAMVACMKRERYGLIPWCFLLPLYWAFLSLAACRGIVHLFKEPHAWEKTEHGTHIQQDEEASWKETSQAIIAMQKEDEAFHAAKTAQDLKPVKVPTPRPLKSVTEEILAMPTVQAPAITKEMKKAKSLAAKAQVQDFWLIAVLALSSLSGILATLYYYQAHELLLYGDAYGHMMIARRVFDSATPGIAQLGTVWLPLPHILLMPFVMNGFLWRTGLAGSIPSFCCYVLSALFLYLSVKVATKNKLFSFLATLFFIFCPNVLYLQATPLSEMLCICTLLAACYYFLVWRETQGVQHLLALGLSALLATLTRYDGWTLVVVLVLAVGLLCLTRRYSYTKTVATTLFFSSLACSGMLLWLLWNKVIFGDFLYFQHGQFSSQFQQQVFIHAGIDASYHNLFMSIVVYAKSCIENTGPVLFFAGLISAVGIFVLSFFKKDGNTSILIFLCPFLFYVFALFDGQAIIFVPNLVRAPLPQLFNLRYGVQMAAPLAFMVVYFMYAIWSFFAQRKWSTPVCSAIILLVFVMNSFFAFRTLPITVIEGTQGTSCTTLTETAIYLAEHYTGGKILADSTKTDIQLLIPVLGMNFSSVIYEGNSTVWSNALKRPETATWVLSLPGDAVDQAVHLSSSAFLAKFMRVAKSRNGFSLYYNKKAGKIQTHQPPAYLSEYAHAKCGNH